MNKIKNTTDQANHDQKRREFLKKSTLVGVGVVAAASVPATALAEAADQTPDAEKQKGYHVTQHVLDYYKSAAI